MTRPGGKGKGKPKGSGKGRSVSSGGRAPSGRKSPWGGGARAGQSGSPEERQRNLPEGEPGEPAQIPNPYRPDQSGPRPGNEADRPLTRFIVGHSVELMSEVLGAPSTPADLIISRFFAARRYLGSHDRGHIADAVYASLRTVLRTRMMLESALGHVSPDHEASIVIAIRMIEQHGPGIAGRIAEPTGLASDELAFIIDHVAKMESMLLSYDEPVRSAMRHGLPVWFVDRIRRHYGEEESDRLLSALNTQAPITLRVNTLLTDRDHLLSALAEQGIPASPGRWSPDAVHLTKRMNAHAIPEFRKGWFEMQDEGSQVLSMLLDPHPNWKVFDACAGAGGKTLHLAALMKGRGDLVAHDTNARRLAETKPRVRRSGAQNVRVMEHEMYLERREKMAGTFNAVFIDAPCSGTGVLRRNPGMRLVLEQEMVERIQIEQSRILDEYSRLLRPDGVMIYATCSLLQEENEGQIEAFLARHPGWSLGALDAPESMIAPDGFFHSWPHLHGTDGFFAAALRPPAGSGAGDEGR